jgi:hypothetical protein
MYKYLSIYLGRYFSQQLRVKLEWDAGNYGSWVRSVNFGRNGGGGWFWWRWLRRPFGVAGVFEEKLQRRKKKVQGEKGGRRRHESLVRAMIP